MKYSEEQRRNAAVKIATQLGAPSCWQGVADYGIDLQCRVNELEEVLREICDSLRRREGSKLITVNHDELMELIPKARAALKNSSSPILPSTSEVAAK